MNYFEFITDRSATLRLDHHFEGLVLNAIPGIRALNWRLVATRAAYCFRHYCAICSERQLFCQSLRKTA